MSNTPEHPLDLARRCVARENHVIQYGDGETRFELRWAFKSPNDPERPYMLLKDIHREPELAARLLASIIEHDRRTR